MDRVSKRAKRTRGERTLPAENATVRASFSNREKIGTEVERWREQGISQDEVISAMNKEMKYSERLKAAGRRPRTKKVLGDITYGEVEAAIWESDGLISNVARKLRVSVAHVRSVFRRYKMLEVEFFEFRERVNDEIETALRREALDGNVKAISFYLSRQARDRGYGDKEEKVRKRGVKIKIVKAAAKKEKKEVVKEASAEDGKVLEFKRVDNG